MSYKTDKDKNPRVPLSPLSTGASDYRALPVVPIVADVSGLTDSVKNLATALSNIGKAATASSMAFRGANMSLQEVAEIMDKERLEEIRKIPMPFCPVCGSIMRLVEPGEGKRWEPFFGCTRFPQGCRGRRNILAMGVPNKEAYEVDTDDVVMVCPA